MDRELFDKAVAVRARAHARYSRFKVGAALRTASGDIHAGCNVENASYPEGWCAETSAIAHMVAAAPPGRGRRIAEVTVVATPIEGRLVSPCGGCRQRLVEFGTAATLVHLADPSGRQTETWRLGELLPAAFALGGKP
jgi:cytidine deaminase